MVSAVTGRDRHVAGTLTAPEAARAIRRICAADLPGFNCHPRRRKRSFRACRSRTPGSRAMRSTRACLAGKFQASTLKKLPKFLEIHC
jgi:hypothetical protein